MFLSKFCLLLLGSSQKILPDRWGPISRCPLAWNIASKGVPLWFLMSGDSYDDLLMHTVQVLHSMFRPDDVALQCSWLKIFKEQLVPRLDEAGIGISSMWVNEEQTQFIWIRTFNNKSEIETKEAKFYSTDWWKANVDFIRSHHAHREITILESFEL